MDSIKVGNNIRKLRNSEGLTLEQLASALGIKRNMLSNYELGKSSISVKLLSKIADYFDVGLDEITETSTKTNFQEDFKNKSVKISVYSRLETSKYYDEENQKHFLYNFELPECVIGEGKFFGMKVTDDSLNLRGITRGAVAITKSQSVAKPGALIVYTYKDEDARLGIYNPSENKVIVSVCSSDPKFIPDVLSSDDKNFKISGVVKMILENVDI